MAFDTELQSLITARQPHLLAIGEPHHGEPAFPHLRNRILETLAEHGFRSIAIESTGPPASPSTTTYRADATTWT